MSVLEEEIDRTNFEHRRRESPSAKRQDLEDKISELKEELTTMRNENVILKEEIEELGGQNSSIMELNNKIKSELELTNSQLTKHSIHFNSLFMMHARLQREVMRQIFKLNSANLETRLTSNEVVKLSQKLAAKSEEVQNFQEQAMHERRLAEERIHKLETTLVTSKTEDKKTIEFLELTKTALSSQVEVLNIEIDTLRRDTGDQSSILKGITLGRQEKYIDFFNQSEEYKKLYNDAIMENKVLKMQCGTLKESLDHFKGNDRQQLTQMSTFQQSIAESKLSLGSERAKTVREHEKCKRCWTWRTNQ